MPMPDDDLDDLVNAVHELQLKLAKEIDRSRQLRSQLGVSESELKSTGERMANLLARMRTKRAVH